MRYQLRGDYGPGRALAWDKKLNRPVLLQSGMGDLAALARVRHRHILQILDCLPGPGGDHIVLEAPGGGSLAQAAPSASWRERVNWAVQVGHALECLGRHGLGPGSLDLSLVFLDGSGQIKLLPGETGGDDLLPSFGDFLAELFSAGGKGVPRRIARIVRGCHRGRLTIGQAQGLLHGAASPRRADPARIVHGAGVGLIGLVFSQGGWTLPVAGGLLAFLDLRLGLGLTLPWGVWTVARANPAAGLCLAAPLLLAFPYVIGKGSQPALLLCLAPVLFRLGLGYSPGLLAGWLWGPVAGALVGAGGSWLHLVLSRSGQASLWALLLEMTEWRQQVFAASLAAGAAGLAKGRRWGAVLPLGAMAVLAVYLPGLWDLSQLPGSWLSLLFWQMKHRQLVPDLAK